jgi:SAM-dependent methyltransferase
MIRRAILMPLIGLLAACTFQGGGIVPFAPAPVRVAEDDLEVPYVPTPRPVVEAMLDLAGVGPRDYLIDLGSGDGRIAIAAAQRGARALGVDIDPTRIEEANNAARFAQVETRARFRRQDLFVTPIGEATVISMYLLPDINLRLRPRLLTELRPGTRIVSHAFGIGDWRPDVHRVVNGANIYLWTVPAVVAGQWTLTGAGPEPMLLELDQRFQDVTGRLTGGGRTLALRDVTLAGERLRFTIDLPAGPRSFSGFVRENLIEAESAEGWRAQRLS